MRWACNGSWAWAAMSPPGLGCISCARRWYDRVAIGSAADRVESLESNFSTQVRLLSRAKSDGLDEEPFLDELKKVQQQLNAAREEV